MLGQESHQIKTATVSTDTSITTGIYIGGANKVSVEIPTLSVGMLAATANVRIKVSQSESGTYRDLADMGVYSGSSGLDIWEYPSFTGNVNILTRPVIGYNWMKISFTQTASANLQCVVHIMH